MNVLIVRRISQVFFLILFFGFCAVSSLGEKGWQLRGWPVNWFLELDPLAGIGNLLATHTLYKGLLWGLVPVALTILLGRFFCGWVCPFGTLHQVVGYLGKRRKSTVEKREPNRYSQWKAVNSFFDVRCGNGGSDGLSRKHPPKRPSSGVDGRDRNSFGHISGNRFPHTVLHAQEMEVRYSSCLNCHKPDPCLQECSGVSKLTSNRFAGSHPSFSPIR